VIAKIEKRDGLFFRNLFLGKYISLDRKQGVTSAVKTDTIANDYFVVMPAYNAAKTLQRTYDEVMEQGIVDLGKEGASPLSSRTSLRAFGSRPPSINPDPQGRSGMK